MTEIIGEWCNWQHGCRRLSHIELGDRLTVGQWPLEPLILVRFQVPQPCAGEQETLGSRPSSPVLRETAGDSGFCLSRA